MRKKWLEKHPNYHKEWRKKHPDYDKKKYAKWKRENHAIPWRMTKRQRVLKHLPKSCQYCGFSEVLDIHHMNPKKHKNDFKLKELKNYLVLCPNHHRMLHKGLLTVEEILRKK